MIYYLGEYHVYSIIMAACKRWTKRDETDLTMAKQQLDKDWSIDLNIDRLYRVKSRLGTGENLEDEDYKELLAVIQKKDPGVEEQNRGISLNPGYVETMLREDGHKVKVYKKGSQFSNNSVAGFLIYKFNISNDNEGN